MAAIYRILNVATDHFYIGSARNPKKRRWEHWNDLKKKTHHCSALQAAWDEYGEDAFEFEVIEDNIAETDLLRVEDTYLVRFAGQPNCYNTALSSMQPPSVQPETIVKIRETTLRNWAEKPESHPRRGKRHSEETKAKISVSKKANPSKPWLGKTRDEETRKKIGDAQRGKAKGPRVLTAEGRAKILAAAAAGHYASFKGRKHTDHSKRLMSKRVFCMTDDKYFDSLTAALQYYGVKMPTLRRALKTEKPIQKGKLTGYIFKYAGLSYEQMEKMLRPHPKEGVYKELKQFLDTHPQKG